MSRDSGAADTFESLLGMLNTTLDRIEKPREAQPAPTVWLVEMSGTSGEVSHIRTRVHADDMAEAIMRALHTVDPWVRSRADLTIHLAKAEEDLHAPDSIGREA